jgi:EAL domain-containing protein (putative c-di-GMP-specific phosphodiesterase class I)
MSLTQRTREDDRRLQGLDAIIGEEDVVTLYQPILDLRTLDVLGHEVFSRGPAGGPFEDAERLFALAERTGRLLDLERLCRNRALDSVARHLRPGTKLRKLKRDGFGIAIDDMGSGYSSLKALVEVEPDYLKFDISLVRDIDRSLIKRSLLETLVDLSAKIGAKVIAEGIEMEPELATLREMGVPLGQGRFLGPPVLVSATETAAS